MSPDPARALPWLAAACLTVGLAPFAPEPHLVGKLRWIAGGAVGMAPLDWFDAGFHGLPWALLAIASAWALARRLRPPPAA